MSQQQLATAFAILLNRIDQLEARVVKAERKRDTKQRRAQ
jgi:hypothetical protein